MTEQCKHEWEAMHGYLVWCTKCRRPPRANDVIRALNSTERLSAEDARGLSNLTMGMQKEAWNSGGDEISMKFWKERTVMLRAYADTLEGKDE